MVADRIRTVDLSEEPFRALEENPGFVTIDKCSTATESFERQKMWYPGCNP